HRPPGVDAGDIGELVVGKHARHAVARTFAPKRDHDLLALNLQTTDMRDHGFEDIYRAVVALGSKVTSLPRTGIEHIGAFGHGKGRDPRERAFGKALLPLVASEIETVRRQRLVDCAAGRVIERLAPRLVIVGDLLETLACGILALRFDRNRRIADV